MDGLNGATGDIEFGIGTLAATPPAISSQPSSITLVEGDSAYPQVTVTGSYPFQYQWFHDNVAVAHANNATIAIFRAKTSDTGSYHVVVSNSWGTATSIAVTVTVNRIPGPVITAQPANRTVEVGQAASFTVSATGTGSLGYQWLFNGTALSGATGATLQLLKVQTGDAGLYTASVSDSTGSTTSNAAQLWVVPATSRPTFTTHPISQSVAPGANVVLSVATTGYPSVTLQWLHNDVPVAGATGTSYSLNNVQPSDAGSYVVNASNILGTTTSNVATLTVQSQAVPPPPAPAGGGGGGAPSLWFCTVLSVLVAIRRLRRPHGSSLSSHG
ncbi:MAG: immunoglobulin domain-containing protein [Lacunisphaera sp.]|nr:immunoglobulin domain-containing protein [Lacunisphaera sp.]